MGRLPAAACRGRITDQYDDFEAARFYLLPLITSDDLYQYAFPPDDAGPVEEMIGFRLFNVYQALVVGEITIYNGGVRFDDLADVWESAGYARVSGPNGDYWSKGDDTGFDLDDPLERVVQGRRHNMAIVGTTTLVCAPTSAVIERILEHIAEGGESAAGSPLIAPLIGAMPSRTVSVWAIPGELFGNDIEFNPSLDDFGEYIARGEESDIVVGPMPPLLSSLCGVTAGAGRRPLRSRVGASSCRSSRRRTTMLGRRLRRHSGGSSI